MMYFTKHFIYAFKYKYQFKQIPGTIVFIHEPRYIYFYEKSIHYNGATKKHILKI